MRDMFKAVALLLIIIIGNAVPVVCAVELIRFISDEESIQIVLTLILAVPVVIASIVSTLWLFEKFETKL